MKQQLLRGLCLLFVCLATAFASSTMLTAQVLPQSPIGVDIPGVGTKYFRTLNEAFSATKKANKDGCTIYIPSGSYPLSSEDSVRLNRRVNIFGAGAKGEGKTIVDGPITLLQGADGSLIQGLRMTRGVRIYSSNTAVRNVVNSYLYEAGADTYGNSIHSSCFGDKIFGNGSTLTVTNSVCYSLYNINSGRIANVITWIEYNMYDYSYGVSLTSNSSILNVITKSSQFNNGGENTIEGCIAPKGAGGIPDGTDVHQIENLKYEDLFVKYNAKAPWDPELNDWHLKSDSPAKGKGVNGSDPGIYGGAGFDDKMMSPLPRIVITEAPVKTNAEGKLILKVRIDQN